MWIERWNPFGEFDNLARVRAAHTDPAAASAITWRPVADVVEDAEGVTVRLEVPGVEKDAISVTVEQGTLTVSGEKKADTAEGDATWRRVESWRGAFQRSFALSDHLDPERIEAAYRAGVLTLRLPRRESSKPRRVDVTVH